MEDAARSLLDLWDLAERTVDELDAADWARPLPVGVPGPVDVAELTLHLAGLHYATTDAVRAGLAAARRRAALRLLGHRAGDPELGAQCLDMCLHVHDLLAALGRRADLAGHEGAAREACHLVMGCLPRLLVAAVGGDDTTLRVVVRGDDHIRDVHVARGAVVPGRAPRCADRLDTEPAALVLLLAGRRDADDLRAEGVLSWSGPVADAFVHRARLGAAQARNAG